jgi:transposase
VPKIGPVHLTTIRRSYKGKEYFSHLLRRSFREGGKVKSQTVGNLSALPSAAIEAVRAILRGEAVAPLFDTVTIERSLPHGHVLSVLGVLRQLQLDQLISSTPSRQRDLVVGMIVNRLLRPASKLATTRLWQASTLAGVLGIENADEDELYSAMDWLGERQERIEQKLAKRHLKDGGMVLYDLSSTYFEGRHCPLARIGYSRDGRCGSLQVEFGLTTDEEGRPIAVEVFAGNTSDPATVASEVERIKQRFQLADVVLVGDRGMLTSARIKALEKHGGIAWISCLRSPQIQALVNSGELQLGIFDERNLAEIQSVDFVGERLVVCKNQYLADERGRKREELLQATEVELAKIAASVSAGRLKGAGAIGERVGKVVQRFKVAKHFTRTISEGSFSYARDQSSIDTEKALDGFYIIRTNVSADRLSSTEAVRAYKRLAVAERAFRGIKADDLQVRPFRHYLERRVRAHIFLCMLAYYVQWHLEQAWAPLLFRDENKPIPEDPVAPAKRSDAATHKARTGLLLDGTRAHSLRTLLEEMATLVKSRVRIGATDQATFDRLSQPTPLQSRALALLGLTPNTL